MVIGSTTVTVDGAIRFEAKDAVSLAAVTTSGDLPPYASEDQEFLPRKSTISAWCSLEMSVPAFMRLRAKGLRAGDRGGP